MTRVVYLPACSSSYYLNMKFKDRSLNWWSDDSYIRHTGLLASYYYNTKVEDYRKFVSLPDEMLLFVDSGGFSVVTAGAVIDPKDVIDWMNECADIGVILDIPPYDFGSTAQFGGNAKNQFKKCLAQTIENSKIMYERWNKKFQLYMVMQGETFSQKTEWLHELMKIGEFSGCALSPKPSYDMYQIASHMMIAYNHKIKNIHILQVTGTKGMATIYYISKLLNFFDLVTFDSSTETRYYVIVGVCHEINKDISVLKEKSGRVAFALSLHNLQMKVRETEMLEKMSLAELKKLINDDSLINYINKVARDPGRQKEIEEVYFEKFCFDDTPDKQSNLFSF